MARMSLVTAVMTPATASRSVMKSVTCMASSSVLARPNWRDDARLWSQPISSCGKGRDPDRAACGAELHGPRTLDPGEGSEPRCSMSSAGYARLRRDDWGACRNGMQVVEFEPAHLRRASEWADKSADIAGDNESARSPWIPVIACCGATWPMFISEPHANSNA